MMTCAIHRIALAGRGERRFPHKPLSKGDFAFSAHDRQGNERKPRCLSEHPRPLSANTGRGHFSPRCGGELSFARDVLQAVINEGGSPFPGCPPYYCRCISDSELIAALLEKPAGTLGSPGVQISSPSQCSRGTSQSRPYPARPLKMMESAAQYAYDWGAAPSELAYQSPVTGLAGCRPGFPMKEPSRGILLSDSADASSNQREAPRVVVWLCLAAHSKTPMKQGGHFTSLSVGFHTPTARLLSTARGQTTPGITFPSDMPCGRPIILWALLTRLNLGLVVIQGCETATGTNNPLNRQADGNTFAAESPDEGGIWFSPFRLLSTVAHETVEPVAGHRVAAKPQTALSLLGLRECPATGIVRHIEGTGHGLMRLYDIRNPRQCLPCRVFSNRTQRRDAQPFAPRSPAIPCWLCTNTNDRGEPLTP